MEDVKKVEQAGDGKVALVLLRDGTQFGKKGDTVRVAADTATSLTRIRKNDKGGGEVEEFRLARLETELEPPVPMGTLTQGEAADLGIKNVVVTPPDTILPKSLANASDKKIQAAAANAGGTAPTGDGKKTAGAKQTKPAGANKTAKGAVGKKTADAAPPPVKKINPPETNPDNAGTTA